MSSSEYWLVHKWTIDNFEHFYKEEWNFNRIESNKFYLNSNKEDHPNQFHLCLHPNGEKDKYANNVTLFLYRSSVQQESVNVWLQMSILDANGEKRNTRALIHVFDERHDHFGFGHYIRVIDLLNKSNGLLCGDKLTLLCELHVNGHGQMKDNSAICEVSESNSNAQPQVSLSLAHKWTIDNFGNIHRDQWPIHKIESEKFNSPYDAKRQFYLCLFPNGITDEHRDYMTVGLSRVSKDHHEDLSVLWKVSILNVKGQKWYTRGEQIKFTQTLNNWGMGYFISISKLLEHSNEFLHDDKLDLFYEIKILTTEVNHITNWTARHESLRLASNPEYNPSYDSINLSKCAHKWTIHNFSSVLSNEPSSENSLLSRRFTSSPQKHYYFNLSILPIGHDEEGRSCVSLELHSDFFERMSLTFQMRISLIGANEMKFPFHDLRHFIESYKCHSGIAFIEKTISLDELCQNNMLNSDGSITLYCEIDAIENRGQIVLSDKEKQSYLVKLAKLKLAESQVTDSVTNATGKKVQLEYTWEIEDLRKIYDYAKSLPFVSSQHSIERNFIRSPIFSPPNTNQHQFYLRLYPCGVNEEFRDCVAMGLGVLPSGKSQITSEYSISLLDSVGFKCNTRKGQMRYGGDQGFGWPRYITHEDLFNPANAFFTDNNKLVVHCAVEFVDEEEEELIDVQQKQNKLEEINNFSTPPITNQTVVTPTESITQVNLLIHQWAIDNFGLYFHSNQNEQANSNYLECNKFSPVNDDQLRFVLECRPKPDSESETFEIFFDLISDKKTDQNDVFADVAISLLNENGIKCFKSRVYTFPPWNTEYPEFDWKDTQMEPKSINQLKLLFSYQICTHYSSLTEMRESQQSYEDLAIALNLYNKWQVKRLCDVVTHTRAATSIPVESCTYEWCIPKFSSQRQESLQSSTFSSKAHDFFLRMNKNSIESQDTALIYLCLNKSVAMETNVCLKISILDKDGHKLCTKDNLIKLFEGELQYECGDPGRYHSIRMISLLMDRLAQTTI